MQGEPLGNVPFVHFFYSLGHPNYASFCDVFSATLVIVMYGVPNTQPGSALMAYKPLSRYCGGVHTSLFA